MAEARELAGEWQEVLARYDLGPAEAVGQGGGTASPKMIVRTPGGAYLVRQRRPQSSDDDVVAFDHAVIAAVAAAGLPTAEPLANRRGSTWVRLGAHAYEVSPFISGLSPYTPNNGRQLESAARSLGQFHHATTELTPAGRKPWPREHQSQ